MEKYCSRTLTEGFWTMRDIKCAPIYLVCFFIMLTYQTYVMDGDGLTPFISSRRLSSIFLAALLLTFLWVALDYPFARRMGWAAFIAVCAQTLAYGICVYFLTDAPAAAWTSFIQSSIRFAAVSGIVIGLTVHFRLSLD